MGQAKLRNLCGMGRDPLWLKARKSSKTCGGRAKASRPLKNRGPLGHTSPKAGHKNLGAWGLVTQGLEATCLLDTRTCGHGQNFWQRLMTEGK